MEVDERRLPSILMHLYSNTLSWAFTELSTAWWFCGGTDSTCHVLVGLLDCTVLLYDKMLSTMSTRKEI